MTLAKKAIHISTSGGHTTTHWDNFRSVATDVSDEYDNVCVYAHIKYIVAALASVHSAKYTDGILRAPAVCSWPRQKTKFQNCPAELSNH